MKTQLTIEETIECFGRPMIAMIIEDGLKMHHGAEIRTAFRKAQDAGEIPSESFVTSDHQAAIREIAHLPLCVQGSDLYHAEKRAKRTYKKRSQLMNVPMPESIDDILKGMSEKQLLRQLDASLRVNAQRGARR